MNTIYLLTMKYISTRGKSQNLQFEDVLLKGLATDGGLYIPKEWPILNYSDLKNDKYHKIAAEILHPFLDSFINYDDLIKLTENAYKSFDLEEMAPLIELEENRYILELFHGPTLAFKDFAMLNGYTPNPFYMISRATGKHHFNCNKSKRLDATKGLDQVSMSTGNNWMHSN